MKRAEGGFFPEVYMDGFSEGCEKSLPPCLCSQGASVSGLVFSDFISYEALR